MSKNKFIINRELSWLSFNERVLQESLDRSNPLIERLRFLGIYSNNLDEFFRVRVANVHRMIELNNKSVEGYNGTPKKLLEDIDHIVKKQRKAYELAYNRLLKELEEHNIFHINETQVFPEIKTKLDTFFYTKLKQDVTPILLDKKRKFPRLVDKEIYLAVKMTSSKKEKPLYALIQIPSDHPRFLTFELLDKHYVILLDDIIRLYLKELFAIFDFDDVTAYTFKFTRDADLTVDDDISISMYDKMEEVIKQRKKGEPLRFIYDEKMDDDLLVYLQKAIGISNYDHVAPGGRYHNSKDLMTFPDFGIQSFNFPAYQPKLHPAFNESKSIIKRIFQGDVLLHYPYDTFDHIVDLIREAALDPKVTSIKINIYRVSQPSQIINALINAIKNGKEVTVVVELQARFDEENNMLLSSLLREHGAKIIYGIPGLKVHSKLLMISKKSGRKEQLIAHIGTGNFHGVTAKIYTDLSLLTADTRITKEVQKVFTLLENNIERGLYRHLMVSPFNTRRKFSQLINNEIKSAKKGKDAKIDIKLNNLVDLKMINKLYQAANAGVKIRLIVRGICCMVPRKNITITSIVGRFLEHSRFMIFHNDGNPLYFISSADWMTRNLDKRIEVTTPIYDEQIQQEIQTIFETQWKDNVKARIIDELQSNKYIKPDNEKTERFSSQEELMKGR